MKRPCIVHTSAVLLVGCFGVLCARAHNEIIFARDAAGKLVVHLHGDFPVPMPESPFPEFPGFLDIDTGILSLEKDKPGEGIFQLDPNSSIDITLVAHDPEMRVWTGQDYLGLNESYTLGHPLFHIHLVWNAIPETEPGQVYGMTFIASDSTGLYTASEPFTITWQPFEVCDGDANLDGVTDQIDLGLVLGFFGQSVPEGTNGDLDLDGFVGQSDLGILLADFGCGL
jgi:hypothetical protein